MTVNNCLSVSTAGETKEYWCQAYVTLRAIYLRLESTGTKLFRFFLCYFFIFLAFYKTLLYLQYTTGLSYNKSLTIIYWEHTTNKV